ncbi:agmatine/peptidylarginine deiminase [Glaciimonas sp. PCH181]|uniref:agmatine deiminase family protein n=1 Tax=Glaciimonas sp. PCH181 TaxID=2133943 RepID=UPI001374EFB6|nr:agmatine deiminase family protein [Glaciimonas sp. PCH181]
MFKRRHCLNFPFNPDADTGAAIADSGAHFYMPEESLPHVRTWMQWPAHADLYGDAAYFDLVQLDLAGLARTIAQFEEVYMLARPEQMAHVRHLCGPTVSVFAMAVDDMWARDSGPIFVNNGNGQQAISDLNFNGWGNKQRHRDDAKVAMQVGLLQKLSHRKGGLISEGGAIEVDGDGTVLTTESAIINTNRNPGMDKKQLEAQLNAALGTSKVIWLPGVRGEDITDCHIDLLARFIRPGLVLVELMPEGDTCSEAKMAEHAVAVLSTSTDARGRKLEVVTMRRSRTTRSTEPDMCNGYANYYVCNGAVIVPEFGDASADVAAAEVLAGLYPGRKIVQVNVDIICENGGGIHCVTQQQPTVA